MFEFPYEGSVSRIDVDAVAGTILRRRRRIPGILDMGHLPPQDIQVADVGFESNIVYIVLVLDINVNLDLVLDAEVDVDADSKDRDHLPGNAGGRCWSCIEYRLYCFCS